MAQRIRQDVAAVRSLPGVHGVELNDSMLQFQHGGQSYLVVLPEEYPSGEPQLLEPECQQLPAGTCVDIVRRVLPATEESVGQRTVPCGSDDDGAGGDYGDDDYGGDDDDDDMPMEYQQSSGLLDSTEHEVAEYRSRFGESSAATSKRGSLYVTIKVPLYPVVEPSTAKAWGLDPHSPVEVELRCDGGEITQRRQPDLRVTQGGKGFQLGQQLRSMLVNYFTQQWGRFDELDRVAAPAAVPQEALVRQSTSEVHISEWFPKLNATQARLRDSLLEMGFSLEHAKTAPAMCGTLEACIDADVAAWLQAERHKRQRNSLANSSSSSNIVARAKSLFRSDTGSSSSATNSGSKKRPRGERQSSLQPSSQEYEADRAQEVEQQGIFANLRKTEQVEYDAKTDPKKRAPWRGLILLHIADYLIHRLPTSPEFCVICDRPHVFDCGLLRASVCTRDVCVFAFQEFNVGSDAADSVAVGGGVIDLLLKIFRAAVLSPRADKILSPYPHVPDPTDSRRLLFDPSRRDLEQLRTTVRQFPSVEAVLGCDNLGQLKARTKSNSKAVVPLLSWVITSNRALIVKIPGEHQLKVMSTEHQFLLLTAPPEKQKKFSALKQKHGTKFAFHGSGIENWHAILRDGLKNCSNTELMTAGAAHGSGIYFAPQATTSLGYCRNNTDTADKGESATARRGIINDNGMICLALCEIVTDGIKDHGWCWTVEDADRVMTRFFFVYESANRSCGANASDATFLNSVANAMTYFGAT